MIRYEIERSSITPYVYKTPLVSVNDNGELSVFDGKKSTTIRRITFLNVVGYDKDGKLVSFEPLDCVNQFLLEHHLDKGHLESNQLTSAMLHYFDFILAEQKLWDSEYDSDDFDELYDEPRPRWNYFPRKEADKITFMYRRELIRLALNEMDESKRLRKSTATAYLNIVVNFYKHHLWKGYRFNNPPFEYEEVDIFYRPCGTDIRAFRKKTISSTNLRMNFGKSKRNEGLVIDRLRRDLTSLSNKEWDLVAKILTRTKRVLKNVKGEPTMAALAEEYCLALMICRYTGMRREESLSLHEGQIVKPETVIRDGKEEYKTSYLSIGIGGTYGSLTKTPGVGNKSRVTIIPSSLMDRLYQYTKSQRYAKRLRKFKIFCEGCVANGNTSVFSGDDAIVKDRNYLFISQNGQPLMRNPDVLTTRWSEIRNTVNSCGELEVDMKGSVHNLRSTFAIKTFRKLLKKMPSDKALELVSGLLGHEGIKTTLEYLKIAEENPGGDEIYEDELAFLGIFDELTNIVSLNMAISAEEAE